MSDNNDLRGKIDQAKRRLPLPELMAQVGLGDRAKKTAHCPFHDDEHKSFSVFQGKDGWWHYKCFARCGDGDEIMFLRKLKGLPLTEAMSLYLEMAGFPPGHPPKSHKYPKSHESRKFLESPECPESPVYPMSSGQGLEDELEGLAVRNACTEHNTARKRRWQLVRDLRAVEKRIRRKLSNPELTQVFNGWYRASHPLLDPGKTRDDHLAAFLAELGKVRIPTGEGDTINKALEHVSKLTVSELPVIPEVPHASESWRRIAAFHREVSRRSANNTYFLSCRDTAKAFAGLSHQTAYNINLALARLGVLEIVRIGDARPNGKASKFRYLLAQTENGASQAETGPQASKEGAGQNADDCDT
jgi:CHC2 zinc finger